MKLERPDTASCLASSCLPLQSQSPIAGLEVEVYCVACAITSSTIALLASRSARLFIEKCLGVGWLWGGCQPIGAGPETSWWILVATETRGLTLPSSVMPGLVRYKCSDVSSVVRPAVKSCHNNYLQ